MSRSIPRLTECPACGTDITNKAGAPELETHFRRNPGCRETLKDRVTARSNQPQRSLFS